MKKKGSSLLMDHHGTFEGLDIQKANKIYLWQPQQSNNKNTK